MHTEYKQIKLINICLYRFNLYLSLQYQTKDMAEKIPTVFNYNSNDNEFKNIDQVNTERLKTL